MRKNTEQEIFWMGKFTVNYLKRNKNYNRAQTVGKDLLENKVKIKSALEIGANIGLNLDGLKLIYDNL